MADAPIAERDPLTDSTTPFGDDAHLAAIAALGKTNMAWFDDEHILLAMCVRSERARVASLRAELAHAELVAELEERKLREFEAAYQLPARAL